LEDLSDTILALNFPNGAHHSDLGHDWPLNDTKDIEEGHDQIIEILGGWLGDLYGDDDVDDDESSTSKDDDDSSTKRSSAKHDDSTTSKSSSKHHSTPSLRSNP
jgi:hypothetical protein